MSDRKWSVFLPDACIPGVNVEAEKAEDAAEKALSGWRESRRWADYFYRDGLRLAVKEIVEHKPFGAEPSSLEVFVVEKHRAAA